MSTNITGTLKTSISIVNENAIDSLSPVTDSPAIRTTNEIAFGTGANQINVLYHDNITLADGANTTLNLYDSGTLVDSFGVALTMSAVKFIYVRNNSTDATLLLFGGNSADIPVCSDPTDIIKVKPSQDFLWKDLSASGTVITTNKNLKLAHDGTGTSTMSVDLIIGGLD